MIPALLLPLYLVGAAAIAGPVIVHLRQRTSAEPYDFSTLRFLVKTQWVSSRRRRLMRLLLLALRIAVILALVFGFARLWFVSEPKPADLATVVVVDVSASMRGRAVRDETRKRVHAVVNDAGPNTAVIAMGRRPRVMRGFEDTELTATDAVTALVPTYESGDAEAALRLAGELLETAHAKEKTIVVVSDFARPAWTAVRWNQPLPAGVTLETIRVAESPTDNLAVVAIETPRTFWSADETLAIDAKLRHFPVELSAFAEPVSVELQLTAAVRDKTITQTQTVIVPVNGQATARFFVEPGVFDDLSGEVRLVQPDAALPADDASFFHVPAGRPLQLGRLKHPDTDDTFLRTAIRPRLDDKDDASTHQVSADPFTLTAFDPDREVDALILDHGLTLSERIRAGIDAHLEAGKPLLVIVGPNARGAEAWETEVLRIAGGRTGQNHRTAIALLAGGSKPRGFGQIDLHHPILKPFATPQSGDLFAVEVHRWRALDAPTLEPLIQMPNGDTVMGVTSVGGARIAAIGLELTRDGSTWPVETTFLPVIHQTLAWLTGRTLAASDLVVGARNNTNGRIYDRPGVFDGRVVALDPAESEPRRYTLDTFARLTRPDDPNNNPTASVASTQIIHAGGYDTTLWLLLFAAVAAAAELWLGNRLSRG